MKLIGNQPKPSKAVIPLMIRAIRGSNALNRNILLNGAERSICDIHEKRIIESKMPLTIPKAISISAMVNVDALKSRTSTLSLNRRCQ